MNAIIFPIESVIKPSKAFQEYALAMDRLDQAWLLPHNSEEHYQDYLEAENAYIQADRELRVDRSS
ncbi:hypothetical protein J4G02_15320 [Candidatus Poribacteria bacterium]|nr:hypothetical protein [Candidatus Poribacteria bacterium]